MYIYREITKDLDIWAKSAQHKPLIIRGARQVGKSALVRQWAKAHFSHCLEINFELSPEYKSCFNTLQPIAICQALTVLAQQPITPGRTLLFLDEIQDCPEAIQALRYFKEKMPELHVVAAGSLLELTLREADFRMPVGRVSFLYLYPLSFKEFLRVLNPQALDQLMQCNLINPLPLAIHEYLLKQLQLYFWLGGMPEAVAHYFETNDLHGVQAIQASILETYEKDLGHFSKMADLTCLKTCFTRVPMMSGHQIKYNKIDPDLRSRDIKKALGVLEAINLFHRIHCTAAQGLPLDAMANEKKFKLNFIDVGLMKRVNQLDAELMLSADVMINQGALAEQFVGQELLASAQHYEKTKLYFWARDRGAIAEVDYIITVGKNILPLEVKSGKLGKLRSLRQYLKEHPIPFGLRVSQQPLGREGDVLSIPLYLLSELDRIVMGCN